MRDSDGDANDDVDEEIRWVLLSKQTINSKQSSKVASFNCLEYEIRVFIIIIIIMIDRRIDSMGCTLYTYEQCDNRW